MTVNMPYMTTLGTNSIGSTLVDATTGKSVPLSMQRMELSGRANPAGALLQVTHQFACEGDHPIEAIYTFMLPRKGALRRFRVKGEGFDVKSQMSVREDARKEYETGLQDGHLSVLAETNLDGMVNLSVGQIQPDDKITVVLEIVCAVETQDDRFRFRFPFTLAPSFHERGHAVPTPDGGKIELPSDIFGDLVLPEWKTTSEGLHQVSFRMHVESPGLLEAVSSPSHKILVRPDKNQAEVELAATSDLPDRDLVIDVLTKKPEPVLFKDKRDNSGIPEGSPQWMLSIPSSIFPTKEDTPRKVCFVLDRSGSMQGSPISSACLALKACLSALRPMDEFGIVRFSNKPEDMTSHMVEASDYYRRIAHSFLDETTASGGTHLARALGKAVEILGNPRGDIFLITDGQVFETGPIVEQCSASGARIHVLGIGEASQDRFLESLSRRTNGVSRMVSVSEDVAEDALELFGTIREPLWEDVRAQVSEGEKTQEYEIGTIWSGRPVSIIDQGQQNITPSRVTFQLGREKKTVDVKEVQENPAGFLPLLWASERITDLESEFDFAKEGPLASDIKEELRQISLKYGLASRSVSLSAVVERIGDQPGDQPKQQIIPVGMPGGKDLSQGVFNSSPIGIRCCSSSGVTPQNISESSTVMCDSLASSSSVSWTSPQYSQNGARKMGWTLGSSYSVTIVNDRDFSSTATDNITLMAYLSLLESDGGLPGETIQARWIRTFLLALWTIQVAKSSDKNSYWMHLNKMGYFLDMAPTLDIFSQARFDAVKRIKDGVPLPGTWAARFCGLGDSPTREECVQVWSEVVSALQP